MSGDRVRALVAEHSFVAGLDDSQLDVVAESAEPIVVEAGELLFHEGRPADHCYLVLHGQVGLEMHVPHRGAVTVATVGTDEVLGLSWLLPPRTWRFDARARTAVHAVAIDAEHLRRACDADPVLDRLISHQLIGALSTRLEGARHQLLDLYRYGVD